MTDQTHSSPASDPEEEARLRAIAERREALRRQNLAERDSADAPAPAARPLPRTAPAALPSRDDPRRPASPAAKAAPAASAKAAPKGEGGSFLDGIFDAIDERLPDGVPSFVNGRTIVAFGLGLIVLFVVVGLVLALSGGESSTPNTTVAPQPTPVVVVPTPTPTPDVDETQELVNQVLSAPQPEISPWLNGRFDNPLVFAGLLMALTIPIFTWLDSKARVKVQQFAPAGALGAIALGILGLPLANIAAGNAIATLIMVVLLSVVWAILIGVAIAYRDWTSVSAALMLTAVVGFLGGSFALPAGLGRLVDANWPTWSGVTTLGGLTAYLMAFKFAQAAMTLYVYAVGVLAIILAVVEIGKRQGLSGVVILGGFTLILWVLATWGLNALFDWLFSGPMKPSALLALEVLKPLLAWFLSVLIMAIVGSKLGDDASINIGVNQMQLGLKGQAGIPTVADFLFASTVVGVFLTLIVRL